MYTIGSDTNAPVLAATLVVAVGALQTLQMVVPRYYWDGLASKPEYAYADGYGGHIEAVSVGATQVTITANSCAGADTMTYSRLSPVSAAASVSSWLTALCSAVDAGADIDGDATILGSQPLTANLATGTAWEIIVSMAANYGLDVIHVATDEDGDTVLFRHPSAGSASLTSLLAYQRVETKPQYDYCVVTKLAQITQHETIDYDPNNNLGGVQYTSENQPYLTGSLCPNGISTTDYLAYDVEKWYSYRPAGSALGVIETPYMTLDLHELNDVPPIWGKVQTVKRVETEGVYTSYDRLGVLPATHKDGETDVFLDLVDVTSSIGTTTRDVLHSELCDDVHNCNHFVGEFKDPSAATDASYPLEKYEKYYWYDEDGHEYMDVWEKPTHKCCPLDPNRIMYQGYQTTSSRTWGSYAHSIMGYVNAYLSYSATSCQYKPVSMIDGGVSASWSIAWNGIVVGGGTEHATFNATETSATTVCDYPWYFAIKRVIGAEYAGNDGSNIIYRPADNTGAVSCASGGLIYRIKASEALFSSNFDDSHHPPTIDPSPPQDIRLPTDTESFFDPTAEIDWNYQGTNFVSGNITYQLSQATKQIKLQPNVSNALVTLLNQRTGAVESYRTTNDITVLHAEPLRVTVLGSNDESWSTATGNETGDGCTLTGTVWNNKSVGQAVVPLALWQQARAVMVSIFVPAQAIATMVDLVGSTRIILAEQVYITRVSIDLAAEQAEISGYVRSA